jgi:hypothetical protein
MDFGHDITPNYFNTTFLKKKIILKKVNVIIFIKLIHFIKLIYRINVTHSYYFF